MSNKDIKIHTEPTPNPETLKFVTNVILSETAMNFANQGEAQGVSPLAVKILGFPWAAGLYLGREFLSITKENWVDWETLEAPLVELIREHLLSDEPVVTGRKREVVADEILETDEPVVRRIKEILRDDIRPAVAMDGGDIRFHSFKDGVVYLHMQGACSGCPSSMYTLKEGIETRLRDALPEVKMVEAIDI